MLLVIDCYILIKFENIFLSLSLGYLYFKLLTINAHLYRRIKVDNTVLIINTPINTIAIL